MSVRMVYLVSLSFFLMFVSACQPITREQALASQQASAGQEELLRELAKRILAPRFPGMPEQDEPEIIVGALPPDLPVALPIPEGSRIIGSVDQGFPIRGSTSVYLEAPLAPEAILDFYRETLQALDYEERAEEPTGQVFVTGPAMQGLMMCNAADKTSIWILPSATDSEMSDLHLIASPFENSPCRMTSQTYSQEMLPSLVMPAGVQTTSTSVGGSSSGDVYASADLSTDLPIGGLFAALNDGLAAAGWRAGAQHQDEVTAWSTWTFTYKDEEWQGSLILIKNPAQESDMFVMLRAGRE